jgi:hypothetical protein
VCAGGVGHALLGCFAFRGCLGEAGRKHHRAADAARRGVVDDVGHGDGGGEYHRHVDGLGVWLRVWF